MFAVQAQLTTLACVNQAFVRESALEKKHYEPIDVSIYLWFVAAVDLLRYAQSLLR